MREDSVVYPVSRPLEEGPTKTNVKPYSGAGRKAPPPPPPSKPTAGGKYTILYHSCGPDFFSVPHFTHREFVQFSSQKELDDYVCSKKDQWGASFRINPGYGVKGEVGSTFNYISNQGGVIVERYVEPKFKTI